MGLSLTIRQTMNFIILAFLLFSPLFLVETLAGSNCRCGEEGGSGPADYIINNDDDNVVKPNQYPWVVQLFITKVVDGKRGTFICGGTLVASKYIISAAHCMVGDQGKVRESDIQVTLGEHNLRKRNEGPLAELDLQVQKLVVHPDYNNLGSGNDISLLYLAQEVDLATYTPACLPTYFDSHRQRHGHSHRHRHSHSHRHRHSFAGVEALAVGWGRTSNRRHSGSDVLKQVKLMVVDEPTCQAALRDYYITPDMICAGGARGKDTCNGDSGGPLTYKFHDQLILIGDTSWGTLEGCGRAGKYGVYGRISYFRPWFEKEMNKLEAPSYCSSGSEAGY